MEGKERDTLWRSLDCSGKRELGRREDDLFSEIRGIMMELAAWSSGY